MKALKEEGIYAENIPSYVAITRQLYALPQNPSIHQFLKKIKRGISKLPPKERNDDRAIKDFSTQGAKDRLFDDVVDKANAAEVYRHITKEIEHTQHKINHCDAEIQCIEEEIRQLREQKSMPAKLLALRSTANFVGLVKWGGIIGGGLLCFGLSTAFLPYLLVPELLTVAVVASTYVIGSLIQSGLNRPWRRGIKRNRELDKTIAQKKFEKRAKEHSCKKSSAYLKVLEGLSCQIKAQFKKAINRPAHAPVAIPDQDQALFTPRTVASGKKNQASSSKKKRFKFGRK